MSQGIEGNIAGPRVDETAADARPSRGVLGTRARVLVLILVSQALMIWWVADSELARGIYLICYSLMMPTVLYLLLSRVLRRWLPFEDNELLLGYIVLTATLPIIGFGAMRFPIVGAGYLSYFAKNQPGWAQYVPALKSLPVLHDADAINGLYRGGVSVPWSAWIVPIAFWSAYLLALAGIWLCLHHPALECHSRLSDQLAAARDRACLLRAERGEL